MTDSFFFEDSRPNDTFEEGAVTDEEDEDYDALNSETFGDDSWGGDWEEDHEKLAELAELSRHEFYDEVNGRFTNKIASFLLEEEQCDHSPFSSFIDGGERPLESLRPTPRPPPGFNDGFLIDQGKTNFTASIKNVCTVEEIERGLIKPPPTHLRLEDLERKLISAVGIPCPSLGPTLGRHIIPSPQMNSISPTRLHFGPTHPLHNHPLFLRPPIIPAQILRAPNRLGPLFNRVPLIHPQARLLKDPYAGLMTKSEKLWISSIQIMQLQTNHQFHSDYYYLMYHHRHSGGRKINPLKPSRELPNAYKTYSPQQFENSLGKLQAGSVTAPRKIIDTEIVEKSSIDSSSATSSSRKRKLILLEIEQMYNDVLKAEEMLSPLITHQVDGVETPNDLFSKTVNFLTKEGKLKSIMEIRKGKNLVVRVMAHCDLSDPLAEGILNLLPNIANRDPDQSLLRALPSIRHYLHSVSSADLVFLVKQRLQPHMSFLLSDKFGVSVVCNVLERGDALNLESNIDFCQMVGSLNIIKEPQTPVVRIPLPTMTRLLLCAEPPLSSAAAHIITSSLATLKT